ncbi:hypothetical protein [Mycobacterium lehmannii]|uniref:hypothetical protein n=1 Tax=Mycobacterium lehmannii TaxID=2048550 RepID=UPI001E2B148C|nr:hypothetical protein [Mycobacterium lehmannii]
MATTTTDRAAQTQPAQRPADAPNKPELSTGQPRQAPRDDRDRQTPEPAWWITAACYVAALATLPVSLNTSWRFFDEVLHIPTAYGERHIMFVVAEIALIVSGAGMAANVRRTGHPGPFRFVVWSMCAVSAYMAWTMSTVQEGLGRVILGPVLGTIMLHLALGLEMRARNHRTGTVARVTRELRERMLSRLGLADDERDALQRTRDRAAYRAAELSAPRRWRWSREARLRRALLAANVADDPGMRDKMLARLSVLHHAHELSTHDHSSPWLDRYETAPHTEANSKDQTPTPDGRTTAHHARARTAGCAQPSTSSAPDRAQRTGAHTDPRTRATVSNRASARYPTQTAATPPQRADADHTADAAARRGSVNGSQPAPGAPPQAAHARASTINGADAPRTLTAVPNSANPHNGNAPAQAERAQQTARRPDVDPAAIQQWLPVAHTLIGDGVTRGRMRRWPQEEHPTVVATILADHAAGTPPSTIGRRRDVHHEMVGKILLAAEAAGALTG